MTRSSIPIAAELRRSARRLDRRLAGAAEILCIMQEGQTLHLRYEGGRPVWSLSGGRTVSAEIASLVTSSSFVAPAGNALLPDLPGQTWFVK